MIDPAERADVEMAVRKVMLKHLACQNFPAQLAPMLAAVNDMLDHEFPTWRARVELAPSGDPRLASLLVGPVA
jgi:hypothetical protein